LILWIKFVGLTLALSAPNREGDRMPALSAKPLLPSDDKRWRIVNGTMRRHGYARNALIETLHTVQQSFGYLDKDSLRFVAVSLRVPLSQAYGVATFYHYFTLKPPGKHTCPVCLGTACYIKGASQLVAEAEKTLGVSCGDTTPDLRASLLSVRCLGSCSGAPVAVYDGELVVKEDAAALQKRLEDWMAHDA
jgi:bidirectional [NiFe] hydrogenase diaphorase subunit